MPDIKQITLPSGTTYDLRDSRVDSIISQGTRWVGVTTTAISDGSTTATIKIDGVDHAAQVGDITSYNNMEFIWNGTKWQEFGSTGSLKALAFKDTASGTVAVPKTYSFTGSATSVSVSGTTTGSVSETKGVVTVSKASSGDATYTPQGSNASSSVSGTCSVTPSGSISTGTGTANYTPAGSISTGSGTANYTPAGSVSTPTISVKTAGATQSITPFGSAGSLPSCTLPTYTVANEILTITAGSFSAGTLPSGGTAVTVKTGDAAYQSSQPSFTGTGAELKFTGTGTQLKFTGSSSSGTISGTAAAQTFTGTGARLVTDSQVLTGASFSGASMTSTGSVTATGSVATATTENKTVTVS